MCTMVRRGRWVNDFGSLPVAEKNPPSERQSVLPPVVNGKLAVPLYLFDGLHRRATSRTVDDFGIDWAAFAKEGRVQLRRKKVCLPVLNKHTTFISSVLNATSYGQIRKKTFRRKAHILL